MEYKQRVREGMISQPLYKVIEIDQVVNPQNRELFIKTMKELIDEGLGNSDGWDLEFSSDYKRFRKIAIPPNFKTPSKTSLASI